MPMLMRMQIFGKEEAEVPVHMVLWSCPAEDPRFTEIDNARLEERFPVGSRQVLWICSNSSLIR